MRSTRSSRGFANRWLPVLSESPTVDFIIPVFNEAANIETALRTIYAVAPMAKRVLVVYDFDADTTVPVVRRLMPELAGLEVIRNVRGTGVLNAVRSGIDAATGDMVIISMADLSDDPSVIPEMVRLIREEGFDLVCASRYMKGGRHIGGPLLKRTLSRMAGMTLFWFGALPVHDATNAFRAYRRAVLTTLEIESRGGFEYSLELTAKAAAAGYRIAEVPSTWRDRSAGTSRFRLLHWLPHYLRWYWYALRGRAARRAPSAARGAR
jgi:dolichol-phosphate mannosyltransferase